MIFIKFNPPPNQQTSEALSKGSGQNNKGTCYPQDKKKCLDDTEQNYFRSSAMSSAFRWYSV